jgi:hypothetical protein
LKVDIIIHATVPYPVTLIDLLNSRLVPACRDILTISIILVESSLRLHLVDLHRPLFYERINQYDLFIYTEDDIRVGIGTVAAYLDETRRIEERVGKKRASDFNVGIVRYEYNFPSNVVMDDKTRHATQNVTRVYWEHSMFPAIDKAVDAVPMEEFKKTHVHCKNHHQGMFLATRDLLLAWKDRVGCDFDQVKNRPGMKDRPSQPAEGTQRVWMSSQQLYGGRHCNVQQVRVCMFQGLDHSGLNYVLTACRSLVDTYGVIWFVQCFAPPEQELPASGAFSKQDILGWQREI